MFKKCSCYLDTHKKTMEMPGIEPEAFHMQSERSTTEPHPPYIYLYLIICSGLFLNIIYKQHLYSRPVYFIVRVSSTCSRYNDTNADRRCTIERYTDISELYD